jgi:hypothetical protein
MAPTEETFLTAHGLEYGLRAPMSADDHDPTAVACAHCQERGYLMRSMTFSLRGVPWYRDLSDRAFDPYVRELQRRLDDPSLVRAIAYDPYDPWLILGFIIGEPRVLTYLQVRGGFRGLGLGTSLAALIDVRPGLPFAAEFPTYDLIRERPGRTLPIGIARNPNWAAAVRPWHPED